MEDIFLSEFIFATVVIFFKSKIRSVSKQKMSLENEDCFTGEFCTFFWTGQFEFGRNLCSR